MTGREEAKRMLAVAEVDLKALRNMLDSEIFEDSVFGFHAQQASEKSLKAWLSLRGIVYPKTHDLPHSDEFASGRGPRRLRTFCGTRGSDGFRCSIQIR